MDDLGVPRRETYWLVRFWFLRALGGIYFVAFAILWDQRAGLIGSRGILPARWALDDAAGDGSRLAAFFEHPSIFWVDASDGFMQAASGVGLVLALATMLGVTHGGVLLALWALQISFAHVGQVFWGYGWETLLCETGLLAVFVAPWRSVDPFPRASPPPVVMGWLMRWLTLRLMLGAGLIKLRGDPCWTDLTCLDFHYETQPNPHPLSSLFHALPPWADAAGVLANHACELIAPLCLFAPRPWRLGGAIAIVAFQGTLIASGNLSFLNWLTIVIAIGCFDDRALGWTVPRFVRARLDALAAVAPPPSRAQKIATYGYAGLVAVLSIQPVVNMLSPRQRMNTSFDRLHVVNTYGAFGSVDRERFEVAIEGTDEPRVTPRTRWREYELPCKPGDPSRAPCLVTPYHFRLDWQMWFAWHSDYETEPWIVRLAYLLLRGEPSVRPLFSRDPFPDRPPTFVRATLWRYRMAAPGEPGVWWHRERVRRGLYLVPVSLGDPALEQFLDDRGWRRDEP